MKLNAKFIILMSILSIGFFSCKDKEEEEGKDEPKQETKELKKVLSGEFVLDNQYGQNMYFSAKEMKISNASNFDFAFAYYDTVRTLDHATKLQSSFDYASSTNTTYPKYFLAGGTSVDLIQLIVDDLSTRSTSFYILPDDFTSTKFDTLKTVSGLLHVFESAKIVRNQVDKSSDIYFSDGFGWSEGTLIGFKTQEGKCGIIKVISDPYNYNRQKVGQIEIAVKFEGE
ncbi:MAG: hypothetical protein J6S93_03160 [Paludibacteraceae bacterium]|nr:hypothetical protein [Paludibacteraceae bacterium]